MLDQLKRDIPFIENKYHKTDEPFNAFARMSYHGWEGDPSTGMDDGELKDALSAFADAIPDTEHAVIKAKLFAFVLDHMRIGIDEHDYFPLLYNWNRPLSAFAAGRWERQMKISDEAAKFRAEAVASAAINCWRDYDHAVPDWHALYELGFPGIRERAQKYRAGHPSLSEKQTAYFDAIDIEYAAILRLIARLRDYAAGCAFDKAERIAECLDHLAKGAPTTMYERLMLIYLYFMLSESVDAYQVRSLGHGLDHDLTAPYLADRAAGRFTEEELASFIGYFLMQFSAIGNYWGQPLYLGGTNLDGSTRVNELTRVILDVYDELGIYNPKLQVKYSKTSPSWYLDKMLDMVRRGHSSFVFVCDDNIRAMMTGIRGIPKERCYDFDVKGCYEFAVRAGEFSAAPTYINLLAPAVSALNRSADGDAYADIEARCLDDLRALLDGAIMMTNELERELDEINPSVMLSATITRSLELARDAYHDGAEYNTTVFVVGGLGSAVDALMAVKYLVYETGTVSLSELKRVLTENWSDGKLRQMALTCPHKYGCGDPEADSLGAKIADMVASCQGRPNARGGDYKVDMHSARQFIEFGRRMGATADGRLAGEETSKNGSAVMGMDRNGVTALIRSILVTRPARFTEGYGFDVMLHETAVQGDDGLAAMRALLAAYDAGGGSTIQFNIFDASTLRDAQAHPEKYQNLQVRVCGWNTLWNNMAKEEQDKYIERSENLQ
ncbi:MAG: hypothetical protein IJ493_07080 [Clostridia bacterium]|nr:hypothetical protein [Clostridia bacterium]